MSIIQKINNCWTYTGLEIAFQRQGKLRTIWSFCSLLLTIFKLNNFRNAISVKNGLDPDLLLWGLIWTQTIWKCYSQQPLAKYWSHILKCLFCTDQLWTHLKRMMMLKRGPPWQHQLCMMGDLSCFYCRLLTFFYNQPLQNFELTFCIDYHILGNTRRPIPSPLQHQVWHILFPLHACSGNGMGPRMRLSADGKIRRN